MKPIIINPFKQLAFIDLIAAQMDIEIAKIKLHDFPDGETYIKFESSLAGREVIVVTSLDRPNQKILPLLFIAESAKAIGANRVGLCAPYLAYMRQDKRFEPGEGITSEYFARLISRYFDWLITVDPHLHRHRHLSEIYSIPNRVLHAAPLITQWIMKFVNNPILIGPDKESEQWVSQIAQQVNAPYLILEKIRHSDKDIEISFPHVKPDVDHTPVLIDDIISTAHTMIETINQLKKSGMNAPICIGIHAVFAGDAYESLLQAGAKQVVTCNAITHPSNQIDVSSLIGEGIEKQLD